MAEAGGSVPFPLLFAEAMPSSHSGARQGFDVTERLAELTLPAGPTGKKDKVLILSNRQDAHADRVAVELLRREVPVCRFHTEELSSSGLLSLHLGEHAQDLGTLALPSHHLRIEEVKSVWFRRPKLPMFDGGNGHGSPEPSRIDEAVDFVAHETEAAIFGLLALLEDVFWVSHPNQFQASDNKLANLKLAESCGLPIPRTMVTNDPDRAKAFYESCDGQMIVKPFCGLPGPPTKGRALFANRVRPEHLEHLYLVKHAPCLFQEYVPKDVELRVTIVGHQVFAAEIHSQQSLISRDDWRRYDLTNTPYYPSSLPLGIQEACLAILAHYGLPFGAIDMVRRPDGACVFLELNANGQWLWVQNLTGLPIAEAIAGILARGSIF